MTTPAAPSLLKTAVVERRSIRRFTDQPVARDTVLQILRAAVWAPSPHNTQPWRFTVLFDGSEKARLADAMAAQLARELSADGLAGEAVLRPTERSRWRVSTAPVVLLCSLVGDGLVRYDDRRRNDLEWQMAVQSVGTVLQTVFLVATEYGLGTCWMAAPMYCPEVVRDALRLPPSFSPQALVLMGYPDGPGIVRPRHALRDVVELR